MSRLFTVPSVGLLAAIALAGCASSSQVTDLDARVKALEDKVAKMESKPAAAANTAKAPAAPEQTPEQKAAEDAALALMKEAQTAQRDNDFATAKAKLAEIQEKYPETRAGKAAARMAEEVNLLGSDAPALEVAKWFQGKAPAANQATLVAFWEVWCPHCKKEMPELGQLEPKFKGKLNFVGLTKMTKNITEDQVNSFLKDNAIGFPVALEKDGSMSKAYKVTGIPAAALIKGGKIIWRGNPATLNEESLNKLIAG